MSESRVMTMGRADSSTGGFFTVSDVARLFQLPESRLRYWSQTGFIAPSERRHGRPCYTFRDLVSIKVAAGLLAAGLPLQRVRRSLDALRLRLPQAGDPLSTMRVCCDRDRVVVVTDEGNFDAATGQLLLDFDIASLRRDVAEVLAIPGLGSSGADEETSTAYGWYLRAREYEARWQGTDIDDELVQNAKRAYEMALDLDPDLAAAWTNLGSLLAELGDLDAARDHFDRALSCDAEQPEARLNLAELALRQGDAELAIAGFRHVLRLAPDFVEAHYGLARALLDVGGRSQALAHLERFCAAVDRMQSDERGDELEHRRRCAGEAIASLRAASPS